MNDIKFISKEILIHKFRYSNYQSDINNTTFDIYKDSKCIVMENFTKFLKDDDYDLIKQVFIFFMFITF